MIGGGYGRHSNLGERIDSHGSLVSRLSDLPYVSQNGQNRLEVLLALLGQSLSEFRVQTEGRRGVTALVLPVVYQVLLLHRQFVHVRPQQLVFVLEEGRENADYLVDLAERDSTLHVLGHRLEIIGSERGHCLSLLLSLLRLTGRHVGRLLCTRSHCLRRFDGSLEILVRDDTVLLQKLLGQHRHRLLLARIQLVLRSLNVVHRTHHGIDARAEVVLDFAYERGIEKSDAFQLGNERVLIDDEAVEPIGSR
ncbi:hypothetical protein PENTCL1PPCAC_1612, partial [Pristionchus entomophagus]